ncbi:PIR protein [Plasmodium ovale]|nr:PIR protein [Plasmodium ovale]
MNFDLYIIYKRFSHIYDYNSYSSSLCDNYLEGYSQPYTDIHSICKKFDNIFKNVFVSTNELITLNKKCEHLSYFIYEKIKSFATNINIDELYETLNYAKDIYNISKDKCSIINFHNNKEVFDKMKELYFRNEILQEIKDKYDRNFIDNEEFCKTFIDESADLYNEIIRTNFCKYDEYYKKVIKNFSNNFEKTKDLLNGKRIEIPEIEKKLFPMPDCKSDEEGAISPQAQVEYLHNQQGIYNPEGFAPHMDLSSNFDTGKNSIPGIVSGLLIGTCSLLFFIYKFTPLGSSLPNKIWKTKEKFNLEDKSDELILDASDNESMDLYNSMYNIQYNSSQNA